MEPTVVESFAKECENPDEKGFEKQGDNLDGWPSFADIESSSPTYSLSAEEQATVAVLQLQHKALETCQKFLLGNAGFNGEEDDNDDAGSDNDDAGSDNDDAVSDSDEDEDELIDNNSKEYKFFEKVFAEDGDLRRYYENNHKKGDFYCLVCGGIGKKLWKRFKDCIGLIQHSTAILKTRRKQAHRAYAQVICKVVGWDIDQLPAIVLKDLDSSLANSKKLLVKPKNPAVGCMDDSKAEPDNSAGNHTDD
ncbi:hypothetical protein VNO78_13525 [Psophocarpus tetragonolobus]|uniref:Uncharacterized protein n=1 Tax=Psophocarpus tetragonolobus TaxID=3891 RepID=A0AAN9SYZ0_PSOTE